MFRQVLFTQWKWSAWWVTLGAIAAFAVPVITVQRAGMIDPTFFDVVGMLEEQRLTSPAYPILAMALGALVGISAWIPDHRGNHVYALSLPVPRWYYALLRLGAGGVLLAPIIAAMLIGSVVATAAATVPAGLHAYPVALSLRFALALLVVYATAFALAAGTAKTLRAILGAFLAVVGVQVLSAFVGLELNVLGTVVAPFFVWPGPFELLFGDWMLIGV